MIASLLTLLAGLTRFLPTLEKWADIAYQEWKQAQAANTANRRAASEADDDATARKLADDVTKAIAAKNAAANALDATDTHPAP